jgi:glutamate racemase
VIEQEGKGIVELIESGQLHSIEMKKLLEKYLTPMLNNNIDCLVLGCTHYHFLTPILKQLLPKNVNIIDSGKAIARQTKIVLEKSKLLNKNESKVEHVFYTNGSRKVMSNLMGWDRSIIQKL